MNNDTAITIAEVAAVKIAVICTVVNAHYDMSLWINMGTLIVQAVTILFMMVRSIHYGLELLERKNRKKGTP